MTSGKGDQRMPEERMTWLITSERSGRGRSVRMIRGRGHGDRPPQEERDHAVWPQDDHHLVGKGADAGVPGADRARPGRRYRRRADQIPEAVARPRIESMPVPPSTAAATASIDMLMKPAMPTPAPRQTSGSRSGGRSRSPGWIGSPVRPNADHGA